MSKTCAFLGNNYDFRLGKERIHDTPPGLKDKLKTQIINLIQNEEVTEFLVGEIGGYETDAYDTVLEVQQSYPHIKIIFVISKISDLNDLKKSDAEYVVKRRGFDDFIFPPRCEFGYKRLSICYRNLYIIENADFIIAYNQKKGNAYKYCLKAKHRGAEVIELSEM